MTPPQTKTDTGAGRHRWDHLFGGRVRTSTVVLIIVFVSVWWVYDTVRPEPKPVEAPQVVPPGFVPDPNYTWVPRTEVRKPPVTITETVTLTPTPTETLAPPSEPEPSPPPFQFPFPLPPPFGPAPAPESTTPPPEPAPGSTPAPAPAPSTPRPAVP